MTNLTFLKLVLLAVGLGSMLSAAEPEKYNAPPKGFEALFNGMDLTGWKENGKSPEHWSVREGVLVYDGKGKDLHSDRQFGDFILQLDWKVEKSGNSGVYLRGSTQVEINDGDSAAKPIWNDGFTGRGVRPCARRNKTN